MSTLWVIGEQINSLTLILGSHYAIDIKRLLGYQASHVICWQEGLFIFSDSLDSVVHHNLL